MENSGQRQTYTYSLPPVSNTKPKIMGFQINSMLHLGQGAQVFLETR